MVGCDMGAHHLPPPSPNVTPINFFIWELVKTLYIVKYKM